MPKLRSEKPPEHANIMHNIEWHMRVRGISPEEMAASMRMSMTTFRIRKRYPSRVTHGETHLAARKLGVSEKALAYGAIVDVGEDVD